MKFDSLVRDKCYLKLLKKVLKNIKVMIEKKTIIKCSCKHSTKSLCAQQHTSNQTNIENLTLKKCKM